jgi:hypothetical protein
MSKLLDTLKPVSVKPQSGRVVRLGISIRVGGRGGQARRLTDEERRERKLAYQREYRALQGRKA